MKYYEVDGYKGSTIIQHKKLFTLRELKNMYKKAKIHADFKSEIIAQSLCLLFGFEILDNKYEGFIERDFVIDTDTDKIYKGVD